MADDAGHLGQQFFGERDDRRGRRGSRAVVRQQGERRHRVVERPRSRAWTTRGNSCSADAVESVPVAVELDGNVLERGVAVVLRLEGDAESLRRGSSSSSWLGSVVEPVDEALPTLLVRQLR